MQSQKEGSENFTKGTRERDGMGTVLGVEWTKSRVLQSRLWQNRMVIDEISSLWEEGFQLKILLGAIRGRRGEASFIYLIPPIGK